MRHRSTPHRQACFEHNVSQNVPKSWTARTERSTSHSTNHTATHADVALQGLNKTCMYCGDGINDLTALGAADVGMALGSSEASAAATLSNRRCSIAGKTWGLRITPTLVMLQAT